MMLEKTVEQAVLGLQQDGQFAAIEVNAVAIGAPVNANNLVEALFGQGRAAFWTSHPPPCEAQLISPTAAYAAIRVPIE